MGTIFKQTQRGEALFKHSKEWEKNIKEIHNLNCGWCNMEYTNKGVQMYIVKIKTKVTKNDKNANGKIVRTRVLEQKHFRILRMEFKTLQEAENYITGLNIGIPKINKYGNTIEVIGTKIYKEVN